MSHDWNVPRPAVRSSLSTTSSRNSGMAGARENLPDEHPTITFATVDGARQCIAELDGHRCQGPHGHRGPCLAHIEGETGLTYRVMWGQVQTEAAPTWEQVRAALSHEVDLAVDRDRARDVAVSLEQQLAAVEALHAPVPLGNGDTHAVSMCRECSTVWPCPTARVFADEDAPIDLIPTEVTA